MLHSDRSSAAAPRLCIYSVLGAVSRPFTGGSIPCYNSSVRAGVPTQAERQGGRQADR